MPELRKTKIICTLGPSVDDEETLRQLILAGMNAARFNFSHGTHESQLATLQKLKRVRDELGRPRFWTRRARRSASRPSGTAR